MTSLNFLAVPRLSSNRNNSRKLALLKMAVIVVALLVAIATNSRAQTFTSLSSFDRIDGKYPAAPLIQGLDGNFYGTTNQGGAFDVGTIFKITPSGQLTTLHDFVYSTDGGASFAGLVLATNGNFYGTTTEGGAHLEGTIFRISPAGKFTTVYNFCALSSCADGSAPAAAMIQASDGNFYGTASTGGAHGAGTVFRMTPAGTLTTLYSFCAQANCADGADPIAPLIQASDGNFYSVTYGGGAASDGTVFKISPSGKFTRLYSFCAKAGCTDGESPYGGGLVQATDGNFYGTTVLGGTGNYGTVFKITSTGKLTTLHNFAFIDGEAPYAGLIQATDGNFYGLTQIGGAHDSGTIFKINSSGQLTTLYSLCSQSKCADGGIGYAGMIQSTNGTLYGPAEYGGTSSACPSNINGCGTVFSLAMGLGPFVETVPTSGKVGAKVIILGNNLTGATSVTFNGTAATFSVVSSTEITATVPAGTTSGTVEVTTPSGTLSSNISFRVLP